MTSDKQAKRTTKRFSKLDAIPAHTQMRPGVRSVLATMYVARKKTLGASAAIVLAGVSAYSFASVSEPIDLETADRAPAVVENPIDAVRGDTKAETAVLSVAEPTDTPTAVVVDERKQGSQTVFVKPTEDVPATAANDQAEPGLDEAAASPIRQIIPVSEGLDLYKKPMLLDERSPLEMPSKAPEKQEALPQFSLPTIGVPSENDMQGFLGASVSSHPSDVTPEIAVLSPEEDMSPTIALPEVVPMPMARPTPPVADGQNVEFRIVQGKGVKSGFWIGNKEDPSVRRFFVIVKSYLADGSNVNWKFTNIADGSAEDTDTMAVEVTEETFAALAKEAKEFGGIKDPVLGRGVTGKKDVKWRISSVGGNLLAGWDKETRK
jgi:hypothetical protein